MYKYITQLSQRQSRHADRRVFRFHCWGAKTRNVNFRHVKYVSSATAVR